MKRYMSADRRRLANACSDIECGDTIRFKSPTSETPLELQVESVDLFYYNVHGNHEITEFVSENFEYACALVVNGFALMRFRLRRNEIELVESFEGGGPNAV